MINLFLTVNAQIKSPSKVILKSTVKMNKISKFITEVHLKSKFGNLGIYKKTMHEHFVRSSE
jgi:hypothetical protein